MNIQNITSLAIQLKKIGFDAMGYTILKHVCLAPANFSIAEKLPNVSENISFIFHFEREKKGETYKLVCYDAILQQQPSYENFNIEGLNVKSIDESMTQIDWKDAFDFSKRRPFNPEDKSGYENETKIFSIIESLKKLEAVEDGKMISIAIKQRHWSEVPYSDLMGAMTNGRSKSEISQRFYFSEGQPVISADEAYRFLLNRWMEKQIQVQKKQQDTEDNSSIKEAENPSGSGLLRKRRIGSNKKNKSA